MLRECWRRERGQELVERDAILFRLRIIVISVRNRHKSLLAWSGFEQSLTQLVRNHPVRISVALQQWATVLLDLGQRMLLRIGNSWSP